MYGLAKHKDLRQRHKEIQHELAVARLEKLARANRETRPYVVRDLSWELARYLDTEIFSVRHSANQIARGSCTGGNYRPRP